MYRRVKKLAQGHMGRRTVEVELNPEKTGTRDWYHWYHCAVLCGLSLNKANLHSKVSA